MQNTHFMSAFSSAVNETVAVLTGILEDSAIPDILAAATDAVIQAYRKDHKVLTCGNGGSAADAQHIAAELSGKFFFDRQPLFAEALHVNTSYMTAVANDYSYNDVFARLVRAQGRPGDVLLALSTSGSSPNVVKALEEARRRKMITVGFTGQRPNNMEDLCDYLVAVPSMVTPRIQEAHITLGHVMCEMIENRMFSVDAPAIFLDRDGVINEKKPEGDYVTSVSEFSILPGVFEAIKLFNDSGYLVVVITNQQCIGKGMVSPDTVGAIHEHMKSEVRRHGGSIDTVYMCPHTAAENCSCRKPAPGLIEMAVRDYRRKGVSIDMTRSYMIGDSEKDIIAGEKAGLHTVRITTDGKGDTAPTAAGILEAAHRVIYDDMRTRKAM